VIVHGHSCGSSAELYRVADVPVWTVSAVTLVAASRCEQ